MPSSRLLMSILLLLGGCLPMHGGVGVVTTTSQHTSAVAAVEGELSLITATRDGGHIMSGSAAQVGYDADGGRTWSSLSILRVDRWTATDPWGARLGMAFITRNFGRENQGSLGGQAHLGLLRRTSAPCPSACNATVWSLDLVAGYTGPVVNGGWFAGIGVTVHGLSFGRPLPSNR